MIKRKGDVFTTESIFIGHGTNCKGVMGAGIAKTVKNKYPWAYRQYLDYLEVYGDESLGRAQATGPADEVVIYNLYTQKFPGPDARYDAIFESCMEAANDVIVRSAVTGRNPVLAIPMIGCGIGGLEWDKVECILRAVEILVPGFQFEVWKYE